MPALYAAARITGPRVREGHELVPAGWADVLGRVVDALAGASGVYRLAEGQDPELTITGAGLIGIAFGPAGELVVCSNETAYRFD